MSRHARRGFTLVELILAIGLLALLMVAVFQLFDRSLSVWRKGETRRALLEQSSVVLDDLASDLRGLEAGRDGNLVLEWVRFDTDGDNVAETKWPRIRLVRQASAAEMQRARDAAAQEARDEGGAPKPKTSAAAPAKDDKSSSAPAVAETRGPGLLEVLWMVAPASITQPDARSEGIVWRGERPVDDRASKSFFARDFFGASNRPPAGATDEVTNGCLWLSILCAAQTSVVRDEWRVGKTADCVATSWDAWDRSRPDAAVHPWNEPHPLMPKARSRALLPRRVRIELEFERPADRIRRTRLVQAIDNQEVRLRVDDGMRVPSEPDSYVLVGAEWMKVRSIDGGDVVVERAQRGTTPVPHDVGAMLHWGLRLVREVPVATYREDWDL